MLYWTEKNCRKLSDRDFTSSHESFNILRENVLKIVMENLCFVYICEADNSECICKRNMSFKVQNALFPSALQLFNGSSFIIIQFKCIFLNSQNFKRQKSVLIFIFWMGGKRWEVAHILFCQLFIFKQSFSYGFHKFSSTNIKQKWQLSAFISDANRKKFHVDASSREG